MGAFLFNSSEESSWGAQLEPGQNLSLMEDGLEDSALLPWTLLGLHRKEGRTRRLSGSLPKRPLATHTHTHKHTHSFTHFVGCTSLRALGLLQEGDGNGPDASRQSDNHGRRKLTQTLDAARTSPPWASSFCTDSQPWPCSEGSS